MPALIIKPSIPYILQAWSCSVKVIDPRLVKPLDWELFIYGPYLYVDPARGIFDIKQEAWKLVSSAGDIILSDKNINSFNEQILANYGLSVTIHQVGRPGDESTLTETVISTRPSLMLILPVHGWLV